MRYNVETSRRELMTIVMNKTIKIVFILSFPILLLPIQALGQYGPLYWDLRDYDGIPEYRLAMNSFNNKQYDEAFQILDSLVGHYADSVKPRRVYQLQNEKGAMQYVIRQFENSYETLNANIKTMFLDGDTLHYEYAVALRFMSYLSDVWANANGNRLEYQKRQLNILQMMNDSSPLYVDCLSDIGLTYIHSGETEKSLDFLQASRKLAYARGDMDHSLLITEHTLANKLEIEQPYLALRIFESQYATAPDKYYRDSSSLLVLAYTLAEKYNKIKEYDKALQLYLKADSIQILAGFPHTSLIPAIPLEIAVCYSREGQMQKFNEFSTRARVAYESISGNEAFPKEHLYNKIAKGFSNLNSDSALVYLQKALDVVQSYNNPEPGSLAIIYSRIANFYKNRGEFEKALHANNTALEILSGTKLTSGGNVTDIKRFYSVSLSLLEQSNELYLEHYNKNAEKQALNKALDAALRYDTLMLKTVFTGSDISAILDNSSNYKTLASRTLDVISKENEYKEEAFRLICNSKAFQLQSEVRRMEYAISVAKNDSLWQKKLLSDQEVKRLNNLKTSAMLINNQILADSLETCIKNELIETIITNYKIIKRQSTRDTILKKDLNLTDLTKKLNDKQLILDIFHTENNIIVSAISRQGMQIERISETQNFDNNVKELLKKLKTGEDFQQEAGILSDYLLKPFSKKIQETEHIIYTPDNILLLIPLDLLPNPTSNKMLLNTHSVSYHYSIPLWSDSKPKYKPSQYSLLAVAPVYSSGISYEGLSNHREVNELNELRQILQSDAFAPLPYSYEELNELKKLADSAGVQNKIMLYQEANKNNLKKHAKDYNILHLSAHGYVSRSEPQFSGIFLATENFTNSIKGEAEWELLHFGELAELKTTADLAVLSACHSAAGALHQGEGIMSLSRACFFAGIPNVIAALWQVNDKNTSVLMIHFYAHLFGGETYPVALQKAKLDCIARGMQPIDWSGFILTGN